MEPTLADVLAEVQALRADLDQRLGRVLDAVDDLRLKFDSHHRSNEELLTNVDLALRGVIADVDAKVATVEQKVEDVRTKATDVKTRVEALDTAQADLVTRIEAIRSSQQAVTSKIDEVKGELAQQRISQVNR